jgi:AcrR family transcriptional regulator
VARRTYTSPLREEGAARTRQVILEAARSCFARQGYVRTSVAQVAAAAGVAAATVYATVGGKTQLMQAIVHMDIDAGSIADFLLRLQTMTDGREIVRLTAQSTAVVIDELIDTITLLIDNRLADPAVTEAYELAVSIYRQRLDLVAERLHACGALGRELSVARAGEILWFYFGHPAWLTARDLGWPVEVTMNWLADQATGALLTM